jgi:hypothetical protein
MNSGSSIANYGGKHLDNSQFIKTFNIGDDKGLALWIYKKLPTGLKVQMPYDTKTPVYINNEVTVNNDLHVEKDLYVTGSIFNPSDIVLKENIESISVKKMRNLLHLKPIEFSYKTDTHKQKHYGFIAQEIEKIYPELVKSSNLNYNRMHYKRVNYIELIPILVAQIQIMQKEIDELKEQLN